MRTVTSKMLGTKIFLVALLAFIGLTMQGQTYTITNSSLNVGNPGGYRTASDATNSGGAQVINGATGNASLNYWSNAVAIPFTFEFADSVMTHFIVNKNGLMTFDTAMSGMQVPSSLNVNTSLPNANLPDNTIAFFWEDTSSTSVSSSDYVYVNVEGTAPNRQLWIRYYSFEVGSQSFCYWACVLEETSNKIYVVDMNYASSTASYTGTVGIQLNSTTAWEVSVPLNGTNGSPNIQMGSGSSGATDNEYYEFSFLAAGACVPPQNPVASGITSSGATIAWTAGTGTGSVVEYGATGFTPGSGTSMYVTDTSAAITGLTANTTYDAYVKDSCTNNSSTWVGPATFTTLCSSQISGTVTINPALPASATNFQTFNALATEINACGIGGALTVNVSPGTYNEQVMFMEIVGASAANNIVINGGGATISYDGANTQNSTIQLNGTDHMTIRNLTITNTESSSYGWGIHLINAADSNTIDSCTINLNQTSTSSSFVGIISSNSNTSTGSYSNNANYTMVSNTTVNGGYYGVRFNGGSTSSFNANNMVMNCAFNEIQYYGAYFIYQDAPMAMSNSVSWRNSATSGYGLYGNNCRHTDFQSNMINGAGTYGIYLYNNNLSSQSPTQRCTLANNMIIAKSSGDGIYLSGSDQVDIFHNTVLAENDQALWINSSSNEYDVRNNIFSITGSTYVIDLDADPDSTMDVLDYNIYYNSGSGSIAQVSSTNYASLAAWQAGDANQNVNSLEGDPIFASSTDLHVIGILANDVGDNSVGITVDIDGETRPASGSTIVDIGADEYTAASCAPPSGLAVYNVTNNSATAYWTTGGASNWIVQYGTTGFTPGSGTFMLATNDTVLMSGLMSQTTYDVYVKDSCGTSTSPWNGPVSFTTLCDPAVAPYMENFDSLALVSPYTDLPACWEPQTGPDYWDVTNDVINTGHSYLPNIGDHTSGTTNYMWIDASSDITGNAMITGLIDMSALNTPFAGFWFASDNTTNNINHTISLDAWDGTNWVNVATESGNFTGWVEVSGNVPTTVPDTTKFRIQAIADPNGTSSTYYYNDLGVDDFFVMEMPACPAPSSLGAMVINANSAMAYWSSSASSFQVEYDTTGFSLGMGNSMMATNDTVTLSGLMANMNYQVYVRAICAPGDTSLWTGPVSFFTGHCVPGPSSVDGQGITNVTMGTINNTTVAEPGNYGDYSNLVTDVVAGDSLDIDVTYQTGYTYDTWVWVDWNDDLDFLDAGEANYLGNSTSSNPTTLSGSIPIPANAPFGNHRIRIGGSDFGLGTTPPSNPCYTGSYGAFEDYTVNVVPCLATNQCVFPANLTDDYGDGWNGAIVSFWIGGSEVGTIGAGFTSGSTAVDSVSLCDGDSVMVVLKSAGSYPSEVAFDILNPDGINMFSHGLTSGLSSGDTLGTFYSQCTVPSCPITDVPSVMAQTSCGPNPVTFTATGSTNPNYGYFWMRSSDSAIVHLGETFTTPTITANTDWYVGIGAIDESVAKQHVGPLPGIATSGFGNFTNGQWFTAYDVFYLDSITVQSDGALAFQVRISEAGAAGAGSEIIRSDTIFVNSSGIHQVPVELAIAPGNYFINIAFISGFGTGQLFRATSGAVFPYTLANVVSIDSVNFSGARYYYTFDWVVSDVCYSSLATASATLGTLPSTAFPYFVDFNSGLPCNWSTDNSGAEWMETTDFGGNSLDSTAFMMIDDDDPGSSAITNSSLITPTFDTQGYDTLFMSFDHYFRAIGNTVGYVEVWDGMTWAAIDSFSSNTGNWFAPATQTYDITMYQNTNLQVRFRYDDGGSWGWYWSIDNFALDGTPLPCTNVVVDILTDNWGSENTWNIVDTATGTVYASGGPYPDATIANYVDTICLPEGIWYEFRLNDSYGDGLFDGTNTGTYSVDILCPWGNNNVITGSGALPYGGPSGTNPSWDSTVFEITCQVACPDPDSLMATVGCTDAMLSWSSDSSAVSSTIEWGLQGFTPGSGTVIPNATSPYNLMGLALGTSYDFWVTDSCMTGSMSNAAGPYTFTTDTLPVVSASYNVTNVTLNDADVSFNTTGTGSSFSWDFGDGNSGSGASPTHTYTANGTYQVVVTATNNCGDSYDTIQVVIEGIGLDEYGFGDFSLYPNPNDGVFTVTDFNNFGDEATLEVINTIGKVVYAKEFNASSQQSMDVDLRGFAPGVYQLRLSNSKGVGIKPFVIRN